MKIDLENCIKFFDFGFVEVEDEVSIFKEKEIVRKSNCSKYIFCTYTNVKNMIPKRPYYLITGLHINGVLLFSSTRWVSVLAPESKTFPFSFSPRSSVLSTFSSGKLKRVLYENAIEFFLRISDEVSKMIDCVLSTLHNNS